jgi:hypothetical protein
MAFLDLQARLLSCFVTRVRALCLPVDLQSELVCVSSSALAWYLLLEIAGRLCSHLYF